MKPAGTRALRFGVSKVLTVAVIQSLSPASKHPIKSVMKLFTLLSLLLLTTASAMAYEIPDDFSNPPADFRAGPKFMHIDPNNYVREAHLLKALRFFEYNKSKIENQRYITLIDFSKNASERRMYLINMINGSVQMMNVAAGRGSDPDGDGDATDFSNVNDSHKSSLGFYLTDDEYNGENGDSLRLHGLSPTNSNALSRAIVIHGADYVSDGVRAGRSWGCPAVDLKNIDSVIDRLKGGSLLYIFFD